MYTRQEASLIRQKFWTSFGLYMRPVKGSEGDTVNWLNYKTGVRHIYFRMDADKHTASVGIEFTHPDPDMQTYYFQQYEKVRSVFNSSVGEDWHWQLHQPDEHGNIISRIHTILEGVNIFNEADWPAIISFFKPRIIALDEFWMMVKDGFE